MSSGYSVPFFSVQLALRKRNKGIKLTLLLVMEVQHGRTPEQASAWQWHLFLLAVNTSVQLIPTLPNQQKEFVLISDAFNVASSRS